MGNIEITGKKDTYLIDDGTDTFDFINYFKNISLNNDDHLNFENNNKDDNENNLGNVVSEVGDYVRVIANLIVLDEKINCNIMKIRKINDYNELTFSFLESMLSYEFLFNNLEF